MITTREKQNGFYPGFSIHNLTMEGLLFHTKDNRWQAVFRCDCGKYTVADIYSVKSGNIQSCGCKATLAKQRTGWNNRKHGRAGTKLYDLWKNMISRCYDAKNTHYHRYGGRGIRVCRSWKDLENFCQWAESNGWEPNLQLDRRDNSKGYSPGNCHFVTASENCKNKDNAMWIEAFGECKVCRDWSRDPRCQVKESTLHGRIKRGWEPEVAITTPRMSQGSRD